MLIYASLGVIGIIVLGVAGRYWYRGDARRPE